MKVLVTGGAGYIGSHTCLELLKAGHEIVVVDNFVNSSEESVKRVKEISKKDFSFYELDLRDRDALIKVFEKEKIDAVIHFAGLKAVGESSEIPLTYYDNNLVSTFTLLEVMKQFEVYRIVFSSSATVYGSPKQVPIKEDFPLSVTNPYGRTKLMQEEIFKDIAKSDKNWKIILLRYFNPIGAHKSGMIGEDPNGIPNNLVPYITQVCVGKLSKLRVFGGDYDTKDGSGVRDYIHVCDLADGHVKAIERIDKVNGVEVYNLGTGNGYSVLEIIHAFEKVCGKKIPYEITERRKGDIAICYADTSLAEKVLGFKAKRGIEEMCEDAYRWQTQNPNGYGM